MPTVGQWRSWSQHDLETRFGRYGQRLHELARGIDEHPVCVDRPTQSISAEDTFAQDLPLAALQPALQALAERAWHAAGKQSRVGRTVVLKLKTADFRTLTRSHTPDTPPADLPQFIAIAQALCARVDLPGDTRYRLLGVGLANFVEREALPPQAELFD